MQLKTPNPDGSTVNTSARRGFHYREIGECDVVLHLRHKTPNPELRCTCIMLLSRHLLSPLYIGDRVIAISPVSTPLQWNSPNVESRPLGISCHLSRGNQRLWLIREIADRDFKGYETLVFTNLDMPIGDGSGSFPRPRVKPRAAPPRSDGQRGFAILLCEPWPLILRLEDLSALRLLPVWNFSWVFSHSVRKELSLLSLTPLTPSETFRTLYVLDLQQFSKC
jgi:hypothetical protein